MTAYLQPGDKIHVAFPITVLSHWDQTDVNTFVAQGGKYLTDMYAKMGVEVVGWSSSTTLDRPTVVAVIRAPVRGFTPRPTPGNDDLIPRRYRSQDPPEATEPPRAKEFLPHGLLPE